MKLPSGLASIIRRHKICYLIPSSVSNVFLDLADSQFAKSLNYSTGDLSGAYL